MARFFCFKLVLMQNISVLTYENSTITLFLEVTANMDENMVIHQYFRAISFATGVTSILSQNHVVQMS